MATDLHSTIQRILGKTDVLVEKYQALVEELGEVEAEVRKLRNENASLVKENQMLPLSTYSRKSHSCEELLL